MKETCKVSYHLYYLQVEQSDKEVKIVFIYKATSKTTNKVYIGLSTQTLEKRISQHNSHAFGHQSKYHFHCALRKYGADDFIYEIIEDNIPTFEFLKEREKYWIKYYNSYYNGYNSTFGGEGKQERDDEMILELFYEGKTTKEIQEITGFDRSTIYMSYKVNGIIEENNKRNSKIQSLRYSRPVDQYSLNGEYIKTWESATKCGEYFGNQSFVSALCRQENNILSAYGFLFKYSDDPRDILEWVERFKNKQQSGRPKKKIGQYNDSKELICIYESASDAAKALGKKDKSNICAAARKGVKAYGYYWKYE